MISIVMPAYNEAATIGRALDAVLQAPLPDALEVIVVCNGCTDTTAEEARRFGPPVQVIETPIAGKTEALNLGDAAATGFPRIYVDADVVVTSEVLTALVERLRAGDALICSPTGSIDTSRCSWPVRAYFETRSRLPSALEGIGGSGVYAVSREGRARFDTFPPVIADDAFARFHFTPAERATLTSAKSTVFAPRTLGALIRVRSRIYCGNAELSERFPGLNTHKTTANLRGMLKLVREPRFWPGAAIYALVCVIARLRARARARWKTRIWGQDKTTRVASIAV